MSVAAEPESIESSRYLSAVYEALGFESPRGFLPFLGGVVLVVGGNAFTTFSLYHGYRFVGMLRYTLGLRLFRRYLYQLINGMLFPAMEAFVCGVGKGGSLPLAPAVAFATPSTGGGAAGRLRAAKPT